MLGEHLAIAVEDEAARGGNGLDADAVTLRQLGVVVVADHLQQEQARDQDQRERHDDDARDQHALIEDALLAPVILDAHAAEP